MSFRLTKFQPVSEKNLKLIGEKTSDHMKSANASNFVENQENQRFSNSAWENFKFAGSLTKFASITEKQNATT